MTSLIILLNILLHRVQETLSNVREFCHLKYVYDLTTEQIKIYRGKDELPISGIKEERGGL